MIGDAVLQGEHACSQADQEDDGGMIICIGVPLTIDCTARAGGSSSSRIANHPYMSCPLYTAIQEPAQAATHAKYMSYAMPAFHARILDPIILLMLAVSQVYGVQSSAHVWLSSMRTVQGKMCNLNEGLAMPIVDVQSA